jgi:chorismate dehydratase
MSQHVRVSLVDFVNAWPLTWGFLRGAVEGVETITDVPSACADRLKRGEVDAGLIPSIEAARIPGLRIVRGLGIASKNRVRSVLLASNVPVEKIKTIAADVSSRSSVAMARILLADRYGNSPEFHVAAADLCEMLRHHDAALLIGDPALRADLTGLEVFDLAEEWRAMTGLPFVFAVWAVRPGIEPDPFLWSRDFGRRKIEQVIRDASMRTGLSQSFLATYLVENLHHDLEEEDEKGLAEFYRRAAAMGLIPSPDVPPFAGVPLVPRWQG